MAIFTLVKRMRYKVATPVAVELVARKGESDEQFQSRLRSPSSSERS